MDYNYRLLQDIKFLLKEIRIYSIKNNRSYNITKTIQYLQKAEKHLEIDFENKDLSWYTKLNRTKLKSNPTLL